MKRTILYVLFILTIPTISNAQFLGNLFKKKNRIIDSLTKSNVYLNNKNSKLFNDNRKLKIDTSILHKKIYNDSINHKIELENAKKQFKNDLTTFASELTIKLVSELNSKIDQRFDSLLNKEKNKESNINIVNDKGNSTENIISPNINLNNVNSVDPQCNFQIGEELRKFFIIDKWYKTNLDDIIKIQFNKDSNSYIVINEYIKKKMDCLFYNILVDKYMGHRLNVQLQIIQYITPSLHNSIEINDINFKEIFFNYIYQNFPAYYNSLKSISIKNSLEKKDYKFGIRIISN